MRALVINGKIRTTKAKAKAVQSDIEKMITLAKRGDVISRRKLYSFLANDRSTTDHIIKKVIPAFSGRKSGFTRIINLPRRVGDNAQIVRLEWSVEIEKYVISAKKKIKKGKVSEKKTGKSDKVEKKGLKNEGKADKKTKKQINLKGLLKKKR